MNWELGEVAMNCENETSTETDSKILDVVWNSGSINWGKILLNLFGAVMGGPVGPLLSSTIGDDVK